MTDRRIDRSVARNLAELEERLRAVETVIGGGTSREIERAAVSTQGFRLAAGYGNLDDAPGPEVTVDVGRVGIIDVSMSAQLVCDQNDSSAAGFELSGANTRAVVPEEILLLEFFTDTLDAPYGIVIACSRVVTVAGLQPGATTVRMVYSYGAFSTSASDRELVVTPR